MNNELYHYGVLGMRWGHRKDARRISRNLNSLDRQYARQTAKYMRADSKKKKQARLLPNANPVRKP